MNPLVIYPASFRSSPRYGEFRDRVRFLSSPRRLIGRRFLRDRRSQGQSAHLEEGSVRRRDQVLEGKLRVCVEQINE